MFSSCCKYMIWRKQKIRRLSYVILSVLLTWCTLQQTMFQTALQKETDSYGSRSLLQVKETVDEKSSSKDFMNSSLQSETPTNHTCEPPSVSEFPHDLFTRSQRKRGGIFVHLLVALYMFLGLAIICDYYFVTSLEVICFKLKLQPDVAGASLMAIGSSAPELFASLIGVFITKGDIGIGTILGSAVFNVLFVLGVSALIANRENRILALAWWPVTRDTLCYCITLICLAIVIFDGLVTWIEAAVMLFLYAAYLILIWLNDRIEKWFYSYIGDTKTFAERFEKRAEEEDGDEDEDVLKKIKNERFQYSDEEESNSEEDAFPSNPPKQISQIPSGLLKKLQWLICLPINAAFFLTIPDIHRQNLRGYYVLTFILSISWIGFLTYVLVWMVAVIGSTVNIPDTVMGLTFIAFGSSVPDALASMCVAKQGKGDMAVSQALGSNVFDVLFGLGLPWLIKTLIFDLDSTIEVQSVGMLISCFVILVLVLMTLGALHYEQFKLNKKIGIGLLVAYALFLLISVLLELYVWSAYHLPTCKV